MAAGDIIWFEQAYVDTDEALHDKELGTFKAALITSSTTPAANDADPRFGAAGSTDLSTNECTPGGNYPSGGFTLSNPTVTLVSGKSRWDFDDISAAQDASNPTDARWMIVYNTATGLRALFAIDLGADSDLTTGPFSVAPNASGIAETGAAA